MVDERYTSDDGVVYVDEPPLPQAWPPPYYDDPWGVRPKPMTKSYTMAFGGSVIVYGVLQAVMDIPAISENAALSGLLTSGMGVVIIVLRMITNQAVTPRITLPDLPGRRRYY